MKTSCKNPTQNLWENLLRLRRVRILLLGSEQVPSPRARSSTGLGLAGGARMLSLSVKPRGETGDLAVVEGSSSPFVLLREGFCALVLLPGSSCSSKMSLCHCSSWRFFSASKTSWLLSSSLTGKKKNQPKKKGVQLICVMSVSLSNQPWYWILLLPAELPTEGEEFSMHPKAEIPVKLGSGDTF